MFSNTVQSGLISLFSSTGSNPLQLFSQHVDKDLPEDSFIHLLDDTTNEPVPSLPRKLMNSASTDGHDPHGSQKKTLCQTVLHIQSPTIRTTYVRSPPSPRNSKFNVLGLRHPCVHLQVRNLEHEWAFEVGVVDNVKTPGIIRFSTFQKEIRVKANHDPPILLIPIRFPSEESTQLTDWTTVSIDLSSMMRHFQSATSDASDRSNEPTERHDAHHRNVAQPPTRRSPLPNSRYASTDYIQIYANCRLRRVWFSEDKSSIPLPWEFQLFEAPKS